MQKVLANYFAVNHSNDQSYEGLQELISTGDCWITKSLDDVASTSMSVRHYVGEHPDQRDFMRAGPLAEAAKMGHVSAAQELLRGRAGVGRCALTPVWPGMTALGFRESKRSFCVYKEAQGFRPGPRAWFQTESLKFDEPLLNCALHFNSRRYVGVECVDAGGRTPLHEAAARSRLAVVLALLHAGANPARADDMGRNAAGAYIPFASLSAPRQSLAR